MLFDRDLEIARLPCRERRAGKIDGSLLFAQDHLIELIVEFEREFERAHGAAAVVRDFSRRIREFLIQKIRSLRKVDVLKMNVSARSSALPRQTATRLPQRLLWGWLRASEEKRSAKQKQHDHRANGKRRRKAAAARRVPAWLVSGSIALSSLSCRRKAAGSRAREAPRFSCAPAHLRCHTGTLQNSTDACQYRQSQIRREGRRRAAGRSSRDSADRWCPARL